MPTNYQEALDNSSFGRQRNLVLSSWPIANTSLKSADFPRLIDQTALADGTYYCRITISGLSTLNLQMRATFAGGTVTVTAFTTFGMKTGRELDSELVLSPYAYQTFTGTGALTTATLQTSTIAATGGEQFAVVKIVVAGGAAPVFTQAELNGSR